MDLWWYYGPTEMGQTVINELFCNHAQSLKLTIGWIGFRTSGPKPLLHKHTGPFGQSHPYSKSARLQKRSMQCALQACHQAAPPLVKHVDSMMLTAVEDGFLHKDNQQLLELRSQVNVTTQVLTGFFISQYTLSWIRAQIHPAQLI